jgi:hypothetical protein
MNKEELVFWIKHPCKAGDARTYKALIGMDAILPPEGVTKKEFLALSLPAMALLLEKSPNPFIEPTYDDLTPPVNGSNTDLPSNHQ